MAETIAFARTQGASAAPSAPADPKDRAEQLISKIEGHLAAHEAQLNVVHNTLTAFKRAAMEGTTFSSTVDLFSLFEAIEQLLPDADALKTDVLSDAYGIGDVWEDAASQSGPSAISTPPGIGLPLVAMLLRVARGAANQVDRFTSARDLFNQASDLPGIMDVWYEHIAALEQQGIECIVPGGPSGALTLQAMDEGDPRRKVSLADSELAAVIRAARGGIGGDTLVADLKTAANHIAAAYPSVTPRPTALTEFSLVLKRHGLEGFFDAHGRIELRPDSDAPARPAAPAPTDRRRDKRARREAISA